MRFTLALCFLLGTFFAYSTHNRGGQITYQYIGNPLDPANRYTYLFTITVYMNDGPNIADRCYDTLYFGDGKSSVVARNNGPIGGCDCGTVPCGELICPGFKVNTYTVTHTYPGPGKYLAKMADPNRNYSVLNIPNSGNQLFYIETWLDISDFFNSTYIDNSPQLKISPRDFACIGKCYVYNPGAFDPDGDSLSYELTECRGINPITGAIGVPIPGYMYPNQIGPSGTFNMDPSTGTITWCSPVLQGEYNIAFKIYEWRKLTDGEWRKIGYVLSDIQIVVGACLNNPPVIKPLSDTCVVAGGVVTKTIIATDADNNAIFLEAFGAPFSVSTSTANFSASPSTGTVIGNFSWNTICNHISVSPYQITIRATDNSSSSGDCISSNNLTSYQTFKIRVLPPPPTGLTATALGTSIQLTWVHTVCHSNPKTPVSFYKIYRKDSCASFIPSYCETDVPSSWGYVYIGRTINASANTFTDNNGGLGLTHGINYSYVVVAVHTDGATSLASTSVCQQLKNDIPIILNVDVQSTSVSTGSVYVRWMAPQSGATGLDTVLHPPPYDIKLYQKSYPLGAYIQVNTLSYPSFSAIPILMTYTASGLNTQNNQYQYRLDFYSNGTLIGNSQAATSVFLKTISNDRKLELQWNYSVPWSNYKHNIYKKDPSTSSTYTLIATVNSNYYKDSGLVNKHTYCYKVETIGQYSDLTLPRPLYNFSQEVCDKPIDKTPPCSPTVTAIGDCNNNQVALKWNNPRHYCADDVIKYYIYYKPTIDDTYTLLDSISNLNDTIFTYDNNTSIAGCFAILAVDSSYNKSVISSVNEWCIDNCPEFDLPNVVTFNGDGINDFFKAIKVKYVKDIDLKIFNRWGQLLFETTDPYFKWDGIIKMTNQRCTDGTYFYTCTVNEIRIKGIVPKKIKGFFQVFR